MRARLKPIRHNPEVQAAYVDYKRAALNAILEQIPPTTTISQIAGLINYSHEWVRTRLVDNPEYRKDLYEINGRYRIPRGTAVKFITAVFQP